MTRDTLFDTEILANPQICANCFRLNREHEEIVTSWGGVLHHRGDRNRPRPDKTTFEPVTSPSSIACLCGSMHNATTVHDDPISTERAKELGRRLYKTLTALDYELDATTLFATIIHLKRQPEMTGKTHDIFRAALSRAEEVATEDDERIKV